MFRIRLFTIGLLLALAMGRGFLVVHRLQFRDSWFHRGF